jgi:hypothetical protein
MSIQFQETGNVDTECSTFGVDYLVVAGGGAGGSVIHRLVEVELVVIVLHFQEEQKFH